MLCHERKMIKTKNIKITNLLVNTENFRFEPVKSQQEAIDKLVEAQGVKLVSLAEDIMENGLNPNDKIQVCQSHHDETKYNVLEGNRRTVSLKLLFNPDILDNKFSGIKKKFKKLHKKYKDKLISEIECNCYDDPKDAEHWIGIKHGYGGSGIGTEKWDVYSKTRYEEEVLGKSNIVSQVINLLKSSSHVSKEIKENISNIKLTNLHRLISDPEVRAFLGLEYKKGVLTSKIDEKELAKGLEKVALDCLDPKFKVINIYSKEDRKDYIENFPKKSTPDKSKKPVEEKPKEDDSKKSSSTSASNKQRRNTTQRKKLIPSSCKIYIKNPKTNAIYHELQKLDVERYTNAASVLFRVFVELSLDSFLEDKKMIKGPSATKERLRLDEKLGKVESYLSSKKIIDAAISKGIKVATANSNHLLGIDTWHAYVHNTRFSPSAKDLITTWDNIQTFIEKLWEELK